MISLLYRQRDSELCFILVSCAVFSHSDKKNKNSNRDRPSATKNYLMLSFLHLLFLLAWYFIFFLLGMLSLLLFTDKNILIPIQYLSILSQIFLLSFSFPLSQPLLVSHGHSINWSSCFTRISFLLLLGRQSLCCFLSLRWFLHLPFL